MAGPGFIDLTDPRFDVRGDGVADDTAGLQAALDTAARAPGTIVLGQPTARYRVSYAGTQAIMRDRVRYCLRVPSRVTLDLRGGALILTPGANANVLLNAGAGSGIADIDIGILNVFIDGNGSKQSDTPRGAGTQNGVLLFDVVSPVVMNLRAQDMRYAAGRFLKVRRGHFDRLLCNRSLGDGWFFGLSDHEQQIEDCFIGTVEARECTGGAGTGAPGNPVAQGNPTFWVAVRSSCLVMRAVQCSGGHKIADASRDVSIGTAFFDGGRTLNSGLKIQGNRAADLRPSRITVGLAVSSRCAGPGLFLDHCTDVHVGAYEGSDNGSAGTMPDVWIDGVGPLIDTVKSRGAAGIAVLVRAGTSRYRVGTLVVDRARATGSARGPAVHISESRGEIASLTVLGVPDDVQEPALAVEGEGTNLTVFSADITGGNGAPFRVRAGRVLVLQPRVDDGELFGEVSLAPRGESFGLQRADPKGRLARTGLRPLVDVTPLNDAARRMGPPAIDSLASSSGSAPVFRIRHAAAAGGESFFWRFVGLASGG